MPSKATIKLKCVVCGDFFYRTPYDIKRGGGKFCSYSCSNSFNKIGNQYTKGIIDKNKLNI